MIIPRTALLTFLVSAVLGAATGFYLLRTAVAATPLGESVQYQFIQACRWGDVRRMESVCECGTIKIWTVSTASATRVRILCVQVEARHEHQSDKCYRPEVIWEPSWLLARSAFLPLTRDMNLPLPNDKLAGCVWLPRIIAKARLLSAGALPEEYAARFCHAGGVDEQFTSFFGLTKEDVLAVSGRRDEEVAEWFLSSPLRNERVSEWNHIAVNLGRPGFPMAERLPVALANSYKHLGGQKLETVFEVLEADEKAI